MKNVEKLGPIYRVSSGSHYRIFDLDPRFDGPE